MKIKRAWKRHTEVVAIQEFAQMELPLSTPNDSGVYTEHTNVLIPSPAGTVALALIARGDDGYHVSSEFETRTGFSGGWPSQNSKACKDKTEAFTAGIIRLERNWEMGFSREYADRARQIYYNALHKQLTLF
ncbi:MAG: hypothetical protein OSJ34_05260 [Muribaculaceae bacterium]|jgi:hypothetical protein|nr:hypothetical protein [Muribaculaceae bacterium]